jgi:hypothetical protein
MLLGWGLLGLTLPFLLSLSLLLSLPLLLLALQRLFLLLLVLSVLSSNCPRPLQPFLFPFPSVLLLFLEILVVLLPLLVKYFGTKGRTCGANILRELYVLSTGRTGTA